MPQELSDEKKDEVREAYREHGTYNAAADAVGVSPDTVKKYTQDMEDDPTDDSDIPEDVEETMPGNEEAQEPSLFEDPVVQAADAFAEFFHNLNDEHGIGINETTISMMAGEVRDTGRLPQPQNVASFLDGASSGINNNQEIMWVAQRYGQWKELYGQRTQPVQQGQQGMGMGGGPPPGRGSTGFGPGLTEGGVPIEGQQGRTPEFGVGMQGAQGPNQGQGQGQHPQNQQLVALVRQLIHQNQQQQQGQPQNDKQSRVQRLQELKEEKEILEEIASGDDRIEEVEQHIAQLQQVIQEGVMGQQEEQHPQQMGETLEERLLALAATGQADLREVLDVIEDRQQNTPVEVREKELEKDIEMRKLDHKETKYETIGNALENMAEKAGDALGQRLASEPGAGRHTGALGQDVSHGGGQPQRQGHQEPTQQQGQPVPNGGQVQPQSTTGQSVEGGGSQQVIENDDCPECGAVLQRAGGMAYCEACEFTIGPCDRCRYPVEVPPRGEEKMALCPECGDPLPYPPEGEHTVCERCEYTGGRDSLDPHVECERCETWRPIIRREDYVAQQQARMQQMDMQTPGHVQGQGQGQGQGRGRGEGQHNYTPDPNQGD